MRQYAEANAWQGICLVAGSVMGSQAQQDTIPGNAPDQSATPATFAPVVDQCFDQWDGNGDGKLSKEEIEAAVANPKIQGESAAALAAIEKVVRGSKYTIPAMTKDYLIHSPLTEQGGAALFRPNSAGAYISSEPDAGRGD
jgi:hypothetical protein